MVTPQVGGQIDPVCVVGLETNGEPGNRQPASKVLRRPLSRVQACNGSVDVVDDE
jgi:hypothetical protein